MIEIRAPGAILVPCVKIFESSANPRKDGFVTGEA
jgi:hypothetical protein